MAEPYTIPLVGPPGQRTTDTKDERFVNVVFEDVIDHSTQTKQTFVVKRPGLANNTQPPGGAAAGRGIYAWDATTKLYSVFADDVYSGVTVIATALATTSGRAWFVEIPASSGARQLVISDGDDNYNITTSDAVTQIDATDDAEYPASNTGPIVFLDGRIFQGLSNGQLWQSDNASLTSWTAGGYLSVDTHGGALEAHHIRRDQIVAMTKNRIESFFNNGNPSGSVLLRIDQNTIPMGIASKNTLAWSGEIIMCVSENSSDGDGGRNVIMLGPESGETVGTPVLNRFLAAEGTSISGATAWMERVAGQLVYVLNLSSANRTFVYFVESKRWAEWEIAAGSAKFNGRSSASLAGTIYIQDATNGRTYTLSPTTYQDSGSNFTVTCQTKRHMPNQGKPFIVHNIELLADTQSAGTTSCLVSGDDYANFTTLGTFDNTVTTKRIPVGGYFQSHIALRLTNAANAAWRAQALVLDWEAAT